jgi:glycosyltransferase involved in cell wall biosynthesis
MARNTGGPAIAIVRATRALPAGVERTVFCTDAARPAASKPFRRLEPGDLPAGASDIDLRVFPTRPPYSFGFSPELLRAIGREIRRYDVLTIHSLNLFPQLAAYLQARRTRTPYVVTPHGSLDPWLGTPLRKRVVHRLWQDRMLQQAAVLHFTTEDESRLVADLAPGTPRRIIPNGVDVATFASLPDPAAFRRERLGGSDAPVVLFLSRVARKKGIDLLIRAFAQAPAAAAARLVVVGPDDEGITPSLEAVAREAGVADRVHFPGPLYEEQRLEAMAAASVWALTSHTENFGNAVLEAMAARLPVLISEAVNIAPDVRAADAGVVAPLEVPRIAEELDRLLADRSRREQLASQGRDFAERYDWKRVAPRWAEMWAEAASRGRSS